MNPSTLNSVRDFLILKRKWGELCSVCSPSVLVLTIMAMYTPVSLRIETEIRERIHRKMEADE